MIVVFEMAICCRVISATDFGITGCCALTQMVQSSCIYHCIEEVVLDAPEWSRLLHVNLGLFISLVFNEIGYFNMLFQSIHLCLLLVISLVDII